MFLVGYAAAAEKRREVAKEQAKRAPDDDDRKNVREGHVRKRPKVTRLAKLKKERDGVRNT